MGFTPDGKQLIVYRDFADLGIFDLSGPDRLEMLLDSLADEGFGTLSPDRKLFSTAKASASADRMGLGCVATGWSFLVIKTVDQPGAGPANVSVILNWMAEVDRRAVKPALQSSASVKDAHLRRPSLFLEFSYRPVVLLRVVT